MTSRSRAVVAGGLALALAGCQQDGTATAPVTGSQPTAVAARSAPPGFECPRPGTRITYSNGATFVSAGSDPADGFVCLDTRRDGSVRRSLGSLSQQRTTNDAEYRRQLSQLWPLAQGKVVHVRFAPASEPTNVARRTFRVVGPRTMPIADMEREIVIIEYDHESQNFSHTWTLYYDPMTRVLMGGDARSVRGTLPVPSWRVVRVELPGA